MNRTKLCRTLLLLPLTVNVVGCSSHEIKVDDPVATEEYERVTKNWKPSPGHEYGSVTVVCHVDEKGSVSNLRVKTSSGDAITDAAALEAVRLSMPFKMGLANWSLICIAVG